METVGDDSSMFEHDAMIGDPRVLPSGARWAPSVPSMIESSSSLGGEPIAVGSHSITVVYGGDSQYVASTSSTLPQIVNRAGTSVQRYVSRQGQISYSRREIRD